MFFVIGTVHTALLPRHAPDQLRKRQPVAGVARSCTETYDGNAAEQRGAHEIPERELRIVPRPALATVSR